MRFFRRLLLQKKKIYVILTVSAPQENDYGNCIQGCTRISSNGSARTVFIDRMVIGTLSRKTPYRKEIVYRKYAGWICPKPHIKKARQVKHALPAFVIKNAWKFL